MRRFDLTGKVAVVTGGNGGIGLAECGAAVVVAWRNAAKNEAAASGPARLGGAASAVVADATDEGRCPRMMAEAVRRPGRPGFLVNNTEQARGKPPHALPVAEWRARDCHRNSSRERASRAGCADGADLLRPPPVPAGGHPAYRPAVSPVYAEPPRRRGPGRLAGRDAARCRNT